MRRFKTLGGLVLSAVLAAPACGPDGADFVRPSPSPMGSPEAAAPASPGPETITTGEADDLRPGDLARNPEPWIGKTVTVRGEVERVIERRAFTLDEDALLVGPDVLVIHTGATAPVAADQEVTVRGRVVRYDKVAFERDYGWLTAIPQVTSTFSSRPVVLADGVDPAPR